MDALWDFSFKKFFAPKIAGILYAFGIFFAVLSCLGLIGTNFWIGFLPGVGILIISPIVALFWIICIRIALEGLIAVIRVAEESIEIAKNIKMTADNTNRIP
ncbi:MAG: DUF4282 domain-containing protein [Chloroflexaceae bacterium]|nr:DUF4282 domain-containing protein [Chloroflexaceae bacterium]